MLATFVLIDTVTGAKCCTASRGVNRSKSWSTSTGAVFEPSPMLRRGEDELNEWLSFCNCRSSDSNCMSDEDRLRELSVSEG